MSNSILINLESLQEDTDFTRRLAQHARLAYNANLDGKTQFQDPFTDEKKNVIEVETFDYASRQYVKCPGIRVIHSGLYWECHYAGLTKNNHEYFKFRGFSPSIIPTDKSGQAIGMPTTFVTGQIFANKEGKDTSYKMQMRNMQDTALIKAATELYRSGVGLQTILSCMPSIAESDIVGDGKPRSRSSDVTLG